jgi:hypothetical protein
MAPISEQGLFLNTSFSSKLINGPNNLKCYISFGWKGLPVTNTLAYSVQALIKNEMKYCESDFSDCIHFKKLCLKT